MATTFVILRITRRLPLLPKDQDLQSQVRFDHPDVTLAMQTAKLEYELVEELGIRGHIEMEEKTATVVVQLSKGHVLYIRPSHIGFRGYAEWYSFSLHQNQNGDGTHIHESLMGVCTVGDLKSSIGEEPLIFTAQAPNLSQLIGHALGMVFYFTGKRLLPKQFDLKKGRR